MAPKDTARHWGGCVRDLKPYSSADRGKTFREAVMHNERIMSSPSEAECSAIARVSTIVDAADRGDPDSDPKGIIHMLNDLDVTFFGGVLSGNVDVAWSGRVDIGTRGYAQCRGFGRCRIFLSSEGLLYFEDKWICFKETWMTMLHEMCVSAHILVLDHEPS